MSERNKTNSNGMLRNIGQAENSPWPGVTSCYYRNCCVNTVISAFHKPIYTYSPYVMSKSHFQTKRWFKIRIKINVTKISRQVTILKHKRSKEVRLCPILLLWGFDIYITSSDRNFQAFGIACGRECSAKNSDISHLSFMQWNIISN